MNNIEKLHIEYWKKSDMAFQIAEHCYSCGCYNFCKNCKNFADLIELNIDLAILENRIELLTLRHIDK